MMRVDAIIFDLDGTLIDSYQDISLALRASAADLGLPVPSEAEVRKRMHLRLDDLVKDTFPAPDAEAVMRRYRERYDGSGYPNTRPYPGVERTIEVLRSRGYQMFVATNKRKRATEAIIARIGLEGAFELVVSSDISDPPLSKVGLVRRIMADRGLEPSRTVMVGDARGDWDAAKENGIHFILAAYGYGNIRPEEVKGGTIGKISSFQQLVDVLDP